MTRVRTASLLAVCIVALLLGAARAADAFFEGIDDLPLMPGLAESARERTTFDTPAGRIVATHLGTGLADVVFGSAILETATALGLGTVLPR